MALKMKENYQKNATEAAIQQTVSTANVYINRAGRELTSANAPNTTNNTQQSNQGKLPIDCKDVESNKGTFSWKLIDVYHVPYIVRSIKGELLKFVSVRMAEKKLLSYFLDYLHEDIYKFASLRSHIITDSEAKLLNEINQIHTDCIYGEKMFLAGKDYIVLLEEVHEFYTFLKVCYKKLTCNITTGSTEKCGFIRINSKFVVPYCIEDNRKHVPLSYFKFKTEILKHPTVKLENWNLAYLKFCCRIQGISDKLFPSDSCTVINLDDLKNYFPSETNFEEYWPSKETYTRFLINQKSTCVNQPGDRIREPPEVAPAENTTRPTLTAPAPVLPPNIPRMMISYQNRWPPNQMSSTMSQGSSLIRDAGHFVPPPTLVRAGSAESVIGNTVTYSNVVPISQFVPQPPLVCAGSAASVIGNTVTYSNVVPISQFVPQPPLVFAGSAASLIGNTVTYSNVVPISQFVPQPPLVFAGSAASLIGNTASYSNNLPFSQCVPTMYNPITNSNAILHSSQMTQFYTQHSNNSQAQPQQLHQQQITNPQTQLSYSGQSVYDRFTNNQQRHALKNVGPTQQYQSAGGPSKRQRTE